MSLSARRSVVSSQPSAPPALLPATPAPTSAPARKASPASGLDIYTGDPNFMTSLARGLIVIQAFTQQSPQMTILPSLSVMKTGLSPRRRPPRCLYTLTRSASPRRRGRLPVTPSAHECFHPLPHLHHFQHPLLSRSVAHPRAHVRRTPRVLPPSPPSDGDDTSSTSPAPVLPGSWPSISTSSGSRLPRLTASIWAGSCSPISLLRLARAVLLARVVLTPHHPHHHLSAKNSLALPQRPP